MGFEDNNRIGVNENLKRTGAYRQSLPDGFKAIFSTGLRTLAGFSTPHTL